jgi:dCTP deaminase
MSLLRDEEIIATLAAQPPYIEGVVLPADPYSKDSAVQASSVDLHIGNVYLPGEQEADLGGAQNPRQDYSLKTGETAIVTTIEILHLPSDVAGFGFPPSTVSFKGLLMTNPGHVDPGYSGVMRFTVINMGRDPYYLQRGGRIVRLLLFRLDQAVHSNWLQRNPQGSHLPNNADISRLSRDFVDVDRRARKIARKKGIQWSAGIAAAVTLVGILLQLIGSGRLFSGAAIEDLKKRQEMVEYDVKNRVNVEKELQDFDRRLGDLEVAQKAGQTTQPSGSKGRKNP